MERVGTAQEGHQTGLLIHVELVLNQLRSTIGLHYIITARNHAQHLLMLHALAVYVYIKFCRCWRFFRQEYIKITSKFCCLPGKFASEGDSFSSNRTQSLQER